MTPVPNIFVDDEVSYCMTHDRLLKLNQSINKGMIEDINSTTFAQIINDRLVVIHKPNDLPREFALILFYHGLGDYAWDMAINQTNWRKIANENKFMIVFVSGTNCGAMYDKRCGFNIKNPETDLIHMEKILQSLTKSYNITKTYYIGYSNGAIFSSIVAQTHGNKLFTAIVNIMGGFGYNGLEVVDMGIVNPVPILIITGSLDVYKDGCVYAYNFFAERKYNCQLKILPNCYHSYPVNEEENIWNFLNSNNI